MIFRRSAAALALGLVLLLGCGPDDPDPTPKPVAGELVLSLTSPNPNDGALIVRVIGTLTDVTPVGNYRVSFSTQGNLTRVIVTGDVASGDLLRIKVPDVTQVRAYSASVEQAAARDSYALFSTSGYTLTLRAP